MQKLNDHDKELAAFACTVCHKKMRRENPQAIDCAWLGIDNEYCPDVMEALAGTSHVPPAGEPEWKSRMMRAFLGGR